MKYSLKITLIVAAVAVISTVFAAEITFETACSNAKASVLYRANDNSIDLYVTQRTVSEVSNLVTFKKIKLEKYSLNIISNDEIESSFSTRCDSSDGIMGVKELKNLSFKRVMVSHVEGEALPEGIIGLSKDGKTLNVEYLCDERIYEEVACE